MLCLTLHRAFGVTLRSPAVLVTFAPPGLSGARGATSTCPPGTRRTGISSRGARHGRSGGTGRASRTRRLDKGSSGGRGARAVRRSRRTALDGQPRGTTLDGAARTIGSSLGDRGARAANGPRTPETPPRETERHEPQRLPRWPEKPAAGAAQSETWATHETERAERLQTNTSARLKDNTVQGKEGHRRDNDQGTTEGRAWAESGPRAAGRAAQGAAFPDFQGDAGVQPLEDNLSGECAGMVFVGKGERSACAMPVLRWC